MTDRPQSAVQRQIAPQVGEGTGEGHFPLYGALWAVIGRMLPYAQRMAPADLGYVPQKTPFGTLHLKAPRLRATVADSGKSVGNAEGETPYG